MSNVRSLLLIALFSFIIINLNVKSQENKNVKWTILTPSINCKVGDVVKIKIEGKIAKKSHVYSLKKYPDSLLGPQSTIIVSGDSSKFVLFGEVSGPESIKHKDPNFDNLITEYWEGDVLLEIPLKILPTAKAGKNKDSIVVTFMSCDDKSCMPPTDVVLKFDLEVSDGGLNNQSNVINSDHTAISKDKEAALKKKEALLRTKALSTSTGSDDFDNAKKEGFWSFILVCMAAGFGSIFLPCVYPIIPITISFFTKRNHATHKQAIKDVSYYALGIILTFTLVGVLVSVLFGASKLNEFVSNPFVNIIIALIFIALAFSLWGAFELQLPRSIVDKLNKNATENKDSPLGVIIMGIVFALTSFSCTGAVLASLLRLSADGDWTWALAGMAAFSFVFSLPFILFGLFPSLLKSIPKSGGWMNAIKIVFGFLEIAAAVKYLSSADLVWESGILTREVVLAIWITVSLMTGLYLIGVYRFTHDSVVDKIGVPRAIFALLFIFMAFRMVPGMFGEELGEMDALLPPQNYPGIGNTSIFASVLNNSNKIS
ncbi:MAG: cytochrome c biogenesis protein CcdA [Candidatus Kapaibacterium sp.]